MYYFWLPHIKKAWFYSFGFKDAEISYEFRSVCANPYKGSLSENQNQWFHSISDHSQLHDFLKEVQSGDFQLNYSSVFITWNFLISNFSLVTN